MEFGSLINSDCKCAVSCGASIPGCWGPWVPWGMGSIFGFWDLDSWLLWRGVRAVSERVESDSCRRAAAISGFLGARNFLTDFNNSGKRGSSS